AVVFAEGGFDVRLGGHLEVDVHVEQVAEAIDSIEVGRVGQRDGEAVFVAKDGDDAVFAGGVARDEGDDVIRDLDVVKVNDFRAEVGGLGLGDVRRANELIGQHQID